MPPPESAVTGRMVLAFDQPSWKLVLFWFDDASVLEVQQILQAEDAMWDGPSYFEGTSGGDGKWLVGFPKSYGRLD